MKKLNSKFLFIFICALTFCKSADRENSNKLSYVIEYSKLNSDEWKCFKGEDDFLCIPSDWKAIETDEFNFLAVIDSSVQDNFFVLIIHDTVSISMNLNQYLSEVYNQLKGDSSEVFSEYRLDGLYYEHSTHYYAEYYTWIDSVQYCTISMYTKRDENIFDFTMKFPSQFKVNMYEKFQGIIYNYKYKKSYLFDEKERIVEIKSLKF